MFNWISKVATIAKKVAKRILIVCRPILNQVKIKIQGILKEHGKELATAALEVCLSMLVAA